jgi:gamma-glutamyl phosphate reductase
MKSGNAAILRGGSDGFQSSTLIVEALPSKALKPLGCLQRQFNWSPINRSSKR